MYLVKIAWRNLYRNWARTSIAVAAIATVVVIVVFSRGLMTGFTESVFGLYIDNEFGHVRIIDQEYHVREALLPLDYTIGDWNGLGAETIRSDLTELERVDYVLPRIRFAALASLNDTLVRMLGVGVDLASEQQHGALPADISAGRMPEAANEILVGKGLLADLGLELDSRVTLMFSDASQSLRGRTFTIVGVRESGVGELDNNFFYLPLETAQDMLWLEDEVTELLVFGYDAGGSHALKADIDTYLAEIDSRFHTIAWQQGNPFIEIYDGVNDIMILAYILFILMGTVVIISCLTMIVRERTSEIGMMAALGLKSKDIMQTFLLEGIFMGIVGSLVGTGVGGIITFHYSRQGLAVDAFADMVSEVELLMDPVFHIGFSLENLLVSFALAIVIVTLACLYPAARAANLEPVEALRYVDD